MNPARSFLAVLALIVALVVALPASAAATPPGIPTETTARSELAALRVAADGSSSGYSRDLFPHWNTVSGTCNTRETVLKRDLTPEEAASVMADLRGMVSQPNSWAALKRADAKAGN